MATCRIYLPRILCTVPAICSCCDKLLGAGMLTRKR